MATQLDKKIEQLQEIVEKWFDRYNVTAGCDLPVCQRLAEKHESPDEFLTLIARDNN